MRVCLCSLRPLCRWGHEQRQPHALIPLVCIDHCAANNSIVLRLKKNLNAFRLSEHSPVRGGGKVMSKRFRWDHRLRRPFFCVSLIIGLPTIQSFVVLRYPFFVYLEMSLFPSISVPLPFSLCMESRHVVRFPLPDGVFYLMTTGWRFLTSSHYVCMYVWSSHIAEYGSTG